MESSSTNHRQSNYNTTPSINEKEPSSNGGSDHIAAQMFTFCELAAATRNGQNVSWVREVLVEYKKGL
ncbi:hypothetical protein CsatA_013537 [Cannabis sativa]